MFRTCQVVHLDQNYREDILNNGKYRKRPESGYFNSAENHIILSPELTDVSKIEILHFPHDTVDVNSAIDFILKKNGVRGCYEIKVQCPMGRESLVPLQYIDSEHIGVHVYAYTEGVFKILISCNSIPVSGSPFLVLAGKPRKKCLPIFNSNASKVIARGPGLDHILLNEWNEFVVDGTESGSNILFVGISGPKGPSDEMCIRKLNKNAYKVAFCVRDSGEYLIIVKWGEHQIQGSPFIVKTKECNK